ncbi:MAG: hypothetical protein WC496_07600 [Phycisphaerae bacterium]|jgi:hypothetical protein
MKWDGIDRRKGQRRENPQDVETNNRKADRRQTDDRRQCRRIAYPLAAAPAIVGMRLQVVGLSAKAVRFFIPDINPQGLAFKEGDKLNIALKFHDGQVINRGGTISRQDKYETDREYFVCLFDRHLPQERMEMEKEYLLAKFPDFCKEILGL